MVWCSVKRKHREKFIGCDKMERSFLPTL